VLTRCQVGLLPAGNSQQAPFAYQMYAKDDEEGWKQSRQFKEAFSIDVAVEFLGVWYLFQPRFAACHPNK